MESGSLTDPSVGSAEGAVRLAVYDKFQQSVVDQDLAFWVSILQYPRDIDLQSITRFEWPVSPYHTKFTQMQYLNDMTYDRLFELLNYSSLKWGRLCTLDETDNKNPVGYLSHYGSEYETRLMITGVTSSRSRHTTVIHRTIYLTVMRNLSQVALEQSLDKPVALDDCLEYLLGRGFSIGKML